ncbi:hypothetical protein [Sandaracinus amylolyticus]|uniref:hypothetical protein n=1 Tax=Sandaracinus amylolyticus TaxID=927083 RepID=UPI0012ED106A|nr:hypothetical protein [Sandaracinus amylolyticus]
MAGKEPISGLKSEDLRAALADALAGREQRLGELLARHGGLPGPTPNLALAAAFGEAIGTEGKGARRVLATFAADPAKADDARVFLAIAASYGYAARLDADARDAWNGVFELTADDRAPVRIGLIAALGAWAARAPGRVDRLVAEADGWLAHDDRDHRYASAALVLDVIAETRAIDGAEDRPALLAWIERTIEEVRDAPRAAERSPARRRIVASLPGALAHVAIAMRGEPDGIEWLRVRCTEATHPDVRAAIEQAIEKLRRGAGAQSSATIDMLRAALASSAKPPRDPSRIREGTGRGKQGKSAGGGTAKKGKSRSR